MATPCHTPMSYVAYPFFPNGSMSSHSDTIQDHFVGRLFFDFGQVYFASFCLQSTLVLQGLMWARRPACRVRAGILSSTPSRRRRPSPLPPVSGPTASTTGEQLEEREVNYIVLILLTLQSNTLICQRLYHAINNSENKRQKGDSIGPIYHCSHQTTEDTSSPIGGASQGWPNSI
jgi:hypothetical protein